MSVIKECELTHPCLGYNPPPLVFCENTYNEEEKRIYTYNGSYICYRPIFLTIESRVEVFTIGMYVYLDIQSALRLPILFFFPLACFNRYIKTIAITFYYYIALSRY
jgi:hypothetical protein